MKIERGKYLPLAGRHARENRSHSIDILEVSGLRLGMAASLGIHARRSGSRFVEILQVLVTIRGGLL